jgi:hypothetical protein
MQNTTRDLNKDAGKAHGPPEGGAMGFHALNTAAMDDTEGGTSRRPPALSLGASPTSDDWRKTPDRDREGATPQPRPEAAAYRARMLAKVGGEHSRAIAFTDEELADFIDHAKGLGFGQEDIEAILAVKVRKHWVKCQGLKEVAECLAEKRDLGYEIFRDDWDFMRAYREAQTIMLQGGILPPATYLDDEYMAIHKDSFSDMASYLISGLKYEKFIIDKEGKSPNLGYMGALYISTVAEIDRILAESDGDIATIERNLGIPAGAWQDQKGLWRVDIHKPEDKLLRIPDGSEAGANEFWTPGGITSGGVLEAVIAEVPKKEGITYSARQVVFDENVNTTNLNP